MASPLPLSNAFFIRDFEGSWRGELVGGADCEASASRRNADAACSLWPASLGKQFEYEGSAVPIWDEACLVCLTNSFGGERMFGGGFAGIRRAMQHSGSRVVAVSGRLDCSLGWLDRWVA